MIIRKRPLFHHRKCLENPRRVPEDRKPPGGCAGLQDPLDRLAVKGVIFGRVQKRRVDVVGVVVFLEAQDVPGLEPAVVRVAFP